MPFLAIKVLIQEDGLIINLKAKESSFLMEIPIQDHFQMGSRKAREKRPSKKEILIMDSIPKIYSKAKVYSFL